MPGSELLAIAAHLHVLLRRKTGRVTDTEWLAGNAEYAAAIVRYARERAREDGHADLAEWADRLEQAMGQALQAPPRRPLIAPPGLAEGPPAAAPTRYVGGLR